MSKWKKWLKKQNIVITKRKKIDLVQNGSCLKAPIQFGFIRTDAIVRELIACCVGLFLLVVTYSVCPLQDIKPPFWISKEGEEWGEEEIVTELVGQKQKRWGGGGGGNTPSFPHPTNIFLYFKAGNASLNIRAQFESGVSLGRQDIKGEGATWQLFFLFFLSSMCFNLSLSFSQILTWLFRSILVPDPQINVSWAGYIGKVRCLTTFLHCGWFFKQINELNAGLFWLLCLRFATSGNFTILEKTLPAIFHVRGARKSK